MNHPFVALRSILDCARTEVQPLKDQSEVDRILSQIYLKKEDPSRHYKIVGKLGNPLLRGIYKVENKL